MAENGELITCVGDIDLNCPTEKQWKGNLDWKLGEVTLESTEIEVPGLDDMPI